MRCSRYRRSWRKYCPRINSQFSRKISISCLWSQRSKPRRSSQPRKRTSKLLERLKEEEFPLVKFLFNIIVLTERLTIIMKYIKKTNWK